MIRSRAVATVVLAMAAAGCAAPAAPPAPAPPTTSSDATSAPAVSEAPVASQVDLVTEASGDGAGFGLLRAVRVAGREDADRIVFEFVDAVPRYRISYADLPVQSDPAGEDVSLDGTAAVQISLIGSSAYVDQLDLEPAFPIPGRISGDTSQVTELVNLGDWERVLVRAAGVRDRTGFRVGMLDAPPRLVIDVAHSG
jgi:hypothetical protein